MSSYLKRHIGPQSDDEKLMLECLAKNSLDELTDEVIPKSIALDTPLAIEKALSEYEFLEEIKNISQENKVFKNYIGEGYYNCITPTVIKRNLFENPGWYTQYTPYQSEISQGRLESLFNFQTMIVELTGLEIANASLLDEATSAAEAMTMLYNINSQSSSKIDGSKANTFFVSRDVFPQTLDVLRTRAEPFGINLEIGDEDKWQPSQQYYGILLQYPNARGAVKNYRKLIASAKEQGIFVVILSDLLALSLLESPGTLGADVAVGTSQRFGVPLGYGGPHAAYFATKKKFQRFVPGRIVGLSKDRLEQEGYRLALQTREQHIRREKASSNICTAQALLAMMASMYAIYHGPEGLREIALRIHGLTQQLEKALKDLNFIKENKYYNKYYFDTLYLDFSQEKPACLARLKELALGQGINLAYGTNASGEPDFVRISLDETTSLADLNLLLKPFAQLREEESKEGEKASENIFEKISSNIKPQLPSELMRKDRYMSQEVFKKYRSETALMRYMRFLEGKDLALNQVMIPLGSCTMKLNPSTSMQALSMASFVELHPFAPLEQAKGYARVFKELQNFLAEITGMTNVSLQPNSGAQGEYAGLLSIKAYHKDKKQEARNIVLVPTSAHGTNPSSASMAGMEVVFIGCDKDGSILMEDLRNKCENLSDRIACIMVTYPSTHGVFEEGIQSLCELIHNIGALVYLDGANMNAQVGLCRPGDIGADICHLNLHKTFSIPHGGGGPGMGPICVNEKLAPYLPKHGLVSGVGGSKGISPVAAAPWGSASILLISYAYIRMLGADGLKKVSQMAILNANYIKKRLENDYKVLYTDKQGFVAHEMILDMRSFRAYGIEVEDIAKRLIDYSFHAPTMSWPVPGTMMIEPTESEPKEEIDRFCDAMLKIRAEIEELISGKLDPLDNVLKNSPHPAQEIARSNWPHPYSREKAAYPFSATNGNDFKFWSPISRIENAYGDRNLICSCPASA